MENLKAGACERGRGDEGGWVGGWVGGSGRAVCSLGSDVKHPGEMFVILMGYHHGNSF